LPIPVGNSPCLICSNGAPSFNNNCLPSHELAKTSAQQRAQKFF